jgi:hypothetical protein
MSSFRSRCNNENQSHVRRVSPQPAPLSAQLRPVAHALLPPLSLTCGTRSSSLTSPQPTRTPPPPPSPALARPPVRGPHAKTGFPGLFKPRAAPWTPPPEPLPLIASPTRALRVDALRVPNRALKP